MEERLRPMPRMVFYGIAVASVGGPLGLVALYMPQAIVDQRASAGLLALVGAAIFAPPVIIWRRYATDIAGPGGLYSFVEAAVGKWPARIEGVIWTVSYFLYMPYTVVFVVYDILGIAFPGTARYRPSLEVGIAVAMVVALVLWRIGVFWVIAIVAAAQVFLVIVLAGLQVTHAGVPATTLTLGVPASDAAVAALAVSLFFICASLPLFLGGEVTEPHATTRRGLAISYVVATLCVVGGALALPRVSGMLVGGPLPGWEIVYQYGGRYVAEVIAGGVAASILTLILLEYIALARLLHAMLHVSVRVAELGVGIAFIALTAASLIDPLKFYDRLAPPSLVALFLSQLIVFAVYPVFRKKLAKLSIADVLIAIGASALMVYGLYTALTSNAAS